jgi:hypothetical protein
MRPDYQPEMESCSTNVRDVLFYDTVVLGARFIQREIVRLGDQLPVQTESGPVPTHHRVGRDHNEGLLPSGPKSTNSDPEELVEQA